MKNFKKVVAAAAAVAMTMSIGVSAFAEAAATYADGKVNVTGVTMDDGKQYTVIVIAAEKANATLEAADLYYINQGDNGEAFWTDGLGVKEDLAAGDYIARIGGEDLAEVIEIPFTVGAAGEVIQLGDTNLDKFVDISDVNPIIQHILSAALLEGKAAKAADTNADKFIDISDVNPIIQHILGAEALGTVEYVAQ